LIIASQSREPVASPEGLAAHPAVVGLSRGVTLGIGRPVRIRSLPSRRFEMDKKAKTPKKPKQPKTADKKK
jgi:hypothetical protein